jgi:cellobiose-specific phosphotransferase system component IIC
MMKHSLRIFAIMSILMGFALGSSFAQKGKVTKPVDSTIVSPDKVPAEVAKAFKKRFASAADVVWRLIDNNFVVECVARNIPTEATFQKDGTWVSTTEEFEPSTIPSVCLKSVDAYFPKYTLVS